MRTHLCSRMVNSAKTLLLAGLLSNFVIATSNAANSPYGNGAITFQGSVVESTCSVNSSTMQLSRCTSSVAKQVSLNSVPTTSVKYSETLRTEKSGSSNKVINRKIITANYE